MQTSFPSNGLQFPALKKFFNSFEMIFCISFGHSAREILDSNSSTTFVIMQLNDPDFKLNASESADDVLCCNFIDRKSEIYLSL